MVAVGVVCNLHHVSVGTLLCRLHCDFLVAQRALVVSVFDEDS